MGDWIHERSFIYLLSVVLISLVGLLLICWGLWGKRRYRWPRIVPGVGLVLLWACLPMEDWFFDIDIDTWFLEDDIYLFGLAAALLIGPVLVCWGIRGDRSNGRARCPKCWHDMRGTLPQLTCPMCTHDARQTRRLYKSRYRWRLIALGVVLALPSVYHTTPHWFHTTGVYMLGVALIPAAGLLFVCWGIWGDRSKGRVRCPKCWYDMRGTVPRLECPECGHDALQLRQLHRTRRGRRRIILGVGLMLLSTYPLTIIVAGGASKRRCEPTRFARPTHSRLARGGSSSDSQMNWHASLTVVMA
jgi:Zn finger protein HypA/HybF involved in hydrogenase expression